MTVELILVAAALIAGATGTWSPCGFSAVETLGPGGHDGGRRLSLIAAATFTIGALAGGLLTFGALALIGSALGAGSELAITVAAAVAFAAVAGELANARVVPQIRRQVPESWRWRMPLPLVGAAYGMLLGLGFTTFVLTFGVWALAAVAIAAGDPVLGLMIGAAFGAGRAIPVALLAPVADQPIGGRALAAMAERPATYRAFRLANAVALTAAAMTMVTTGALAKRNASAPAYDPSAAGGQLAHERPGKRPVLHADGKRHALRGSNPAIGGGWIALTRRGRIEILWRATRERLAGFDAPGADAIAIDEGVVVWRSRRQGRDRMHVRPIRAERRQGGVEAAATPPPRVSFGKARKLAGGSRNAQLGRPSVDGPRAVFTHAKPRRNLIKVANLKRARTRSVKGSKRIAIQNASIHGKRIAYVAIKRRKQQVRLWRLGRKGQGRKVYSRRGGQIWSTELTAKRLFVTVRGKGGWRLRSFRR